MTERGLPSMDGAPACPFVAFGEDREARSTSPDHRHRCFAVTPPAPRALAHQEAYCLSSAFPVCPTFQDWARREAAHAHADQAPAPTVPVAPPPPVYDLYADWSMNPEAPAPHDATSDPPTAHDATADDVPPAAAAAASAEDLAARNPPRDWAAPPPWATGAATGAALAGRSAGAAPQPTDSMPPSPPRPTEGQGLAGSPADRLAAGEVAASAAWSASAGGHAASAPDEELAGLVQSRPSTSSSSSSPSAAAPGTSDSRDTSVPPAAVAAAATAGAAAAAASPSVGEPPAPQPVVRSSDPYPPATRTGKRPSVSSTRDVITGPSWERMQHVESYPPIRGGSSMRGLPRVLVFAGALGIAALILFMLPAIIGFGGPGGSSSASPSGTRPAASAKSAAPTVVAAPTPLVYVIKKNDTLSKVANKFDVELDALLAANPDITDPNKISLGQQIIIPTAPPASVAPSGGAEESTAPN